MFGVENYRQRILELNASDERGIHVIREKVKNFAQKKINNIGATLNGKVIPEIQIVILDEADLMTVDAQSALRRIIEDYSKTTRFCILCNFLSKIIDPIASRCAKYLFNPLSKETQIEKINYILKQEKLSINKECIEYIIDICEGDLRRAINQIQAFCSLFEIKDTDDITDVTDFNQDEINELCGIIPTDVIEKTLEMLVDHFCDSNKILDFADDLLNNGFDILQFIRQVNEYLTSIYVNNSKLKNLKDSTLRQVIRLLLKSELNSLEGSSNDKELYSLLVNIRTVFENNKEIMA